MRHLIKLRGLIRIKYGHYNTTNVTNQETNGTNSKISGIFGYKGTGHKKSHDQKDRSSFDFEPHF